MKYIYCLVGIVGLLSATGAVNAEEAAKKDAAAEPQITLTSGFNFVSVSGDKQQYRADHWLNNGWTGGIEDLSWHRNLDKGWVLDLDSHAIFGNEDYKLELQVSKPDFMFVKLGYKQYRKYYDSTGGYFPFPTGVRYGTYPSDNLFVDVGNFTVDIGLTRPDLPKITIGYENQYKDGTKSLAGWGYLYASNYSSGNNFRRLIYPTVKSLNENEHIFKFSIEHDIKKVHIGDEFRFERFTNDTLRWNSASYTNYIAGARGPAQTIRETYNHDAFYNAFHMDSQVTDKFYWSLGYMYNKIDGEDGYQMNQIPLRVGSSIRNAQDITIQEDAHVVNGNVYYTPLKTLSVYGGVQYEKSSTFGYGSLNMATNTAGGAANNYQTAFENIDLESIEGNAGIRFTGIPFTTLFAEGRWQEQEYTEDEQAASSSPFVEHPGTKVHRQWYTVGLSCAPIKRVTLTCQYRYSIRENEYTPLDSLISNQKFTSSEISTKLTLRLHPRVQVSFRHQLVATEIDSKFEDTISNESGDYNLNIYSVSVTVTPVDRLYLTGLFSLQDSKTDTYRNASGGTPVTDPSFVGLQYRGDVWSAMGCAGFALDAKTDLTASYTYSRSDNFTDNTGVTPTSSVGLPFGTDYQQHEVRVALTRRIKDNVSVQLRYGYSEYNETANVGLNNYSAQMLGASCTVRF